MFRLRYTPKYIQSTIFLYLLCKYVLRFIQIECVWYHSNVDFLKVILSNTSDKFHRKFHILTIQICITLFLQSMCTSDMRSISEQSQILLWTYFNKEIPLYRKCFRLHVIYVIHPAYTTPTTRSIIKSNNVDIDMLNAKTSPFASMPLTTTTHKRALGSVLPSYYGTNTISSGVWMPWLRYALLGCANSGRLRRGRYIHIESSENPAAASLYDVTFILQFKMWRYAIGTIG